MQQVILQLYLSLNTSKLIRRRTHVDEWRATRDTIYKEIMENGWSEEQQSFVQSYGSDAIDASALLISLTGFTAEADPRIVRTIERIQRELMLTSTATAACIQRRWVLLGKHEGTSPGLYTPCPDQCLSRPGSSPGRSLTRPAVTREDYQRNAYCKKKRRSNQRDESSCSFSTHPGGEGHRA